MSLTSQRPHRPPRCSRASRPRVEHPWERLLRRSDPRSPRHGRARASRSGGPRGGGPNPSPRPAPGAGDPPPRPERPRWPHAPGPARPGHPRPAAGAGSPACARTPPPLPRRRDRRSRRGPPAAAWPLAEDGRSGGDHLVEECPARLEEAHQSPRLGRRQRLPVQLAGDAGGSEVGRSRAGEPLRDLEPRRIGRLQPGGHRHGRIARRVGAQRLHRRLVAAPGTRPAGPVQRRGEGEPGPRLQRDPDRALPRAHPRDYAARRVSLSRWPARAAPGQGWPAAPPSGA